MKKFKKIIFLVCFVMLIAVMAIAVSAYDTSTDRKVEVTLPSGVTTVNNEPVSGTTASLPLYDASDNALTWYVNGKDLTSVNTKEITYLDNGYLKFKNITVTSIVVLNLQDDTIDTWNNGENKWSSKALIQNSTSLQYIYFADSTKELTGSVLEKCTNLKGVYFGENSKLTAFPSRPFGYCTSLTEVVLPPNLQEPKSAFMGCTSLKTITFPASVTTLWYTFSGCTSLEEVIFAEGSKLTVIDQQSFENCSKLTSLNIPDGVTKIGTRAFFGCTLLPSISLNNVTEIGELAFRNCTSLTKVDLPKIKTIGNYAFKGCTGLTTVSIPSSALESLGIQIFMDCSSLKEVTFADVCSLKTLSDSVFENCKILKSINIPNGVTKIGVRAFYDCSALGNLTLPNSVEEIGSRAFRGCNFTEINLGASLQSFGLTNSTTDSENGLAIFFHCYNLQKIVIPASLTISDNVTKAFNEFRKDSNTKPVKIFFTGNETQANELLTKLKSANMTIKNNITIVDYNSEAYSKMDNNKSYIIYNYNPCTAFYGDKHDVSGDPTCTDAVKCKRCQTIAEAALGHEFDIADGATVVKIQYIDGFNKLGTKTCKCTRCDATEAEATPSAPVIFEADGYSVKKNNSSIYGGFRVVDKDALEEYEKVNGPIKYGVIISNVTGLSGINFVEGVIDNEKSIQVEIKDRTFSRFGFSINNFSEVTRALKLVISAYVIDENGNISFIQKDGAMDGSYYVSGISANGVENALGVMTLQQVIALTPAQAPATEPSETKENA